MSFSFQNSKAGFERIRQLLLSANKRQLDVSSIIGDSELAAALPTEEDRISMLVKRHAKEWELSEKPKATINAVFAGTAAGDGDVTLNIDGEVFTITPTAGDDPTTMATALSAEINSNSSKWTSNASGDTVKIIPLTGTGETEFILTEVTDTGASLSYSKGDYILGGTVKLKTESIYFNGSGYRS